MDTPSLVDAPAPQFELAVHGGGSWSLRDRLERGGRPILLVFHRHIH
ncbi:MAG: hypothetical protein AB8G26_12205 [Ilumatobacter sp.]